MNPKEEAPRLYLTPQDEGRTLSLEEFRSARCAEGSRYELIDGRLAAWPFPTLAHEGLRDWLTEELRLYARTNPESINAVFSRAWAFVPGRPGVTCPQIDLGAYRDFPRSRPIAELRWEDFSPVLVGEVISPDNAAKDLERNPQLYWQVPSIEEYWIIDPRSISAQPVLLVLRRGPRRWRRMLTVPFQGTYATPLLPGFTLRVEPHL